MPRITDPPRAPISTPTTAPTENVTPPAVLVIRKISVRPTGAVKDGPSTGTAPRLASDSHVVPAKHQTTARPAAAPQASMRGEARSGAWVSAQTSRAAAIAVAVTSPGRPVNRPISCVIPDGPVASGCGNRTVRSGASGPDSAMNPKMPITTTTTSDRRSPPPNRTSAPKPQLPAMAIP